MLVHNPGIVPTSSTYPEMPLVEYFENKAVLCDISVILATTVIVIALEILLAKLLTPWKKLAVPL